MSTKKTVKKQPQQDMTPIVTIIDASGRQKEIAEEKAVFEKQEQAQKKKAIEDGLARAVQFQNETTGIMGFCRDIRYRNQHPENLQKYGVMPKEDLAALNAELYVLSRRRGLPFAAEDIDYAKLFLQNLLTVRPPPADPKNLLQRMKDAVTSSP